MMKRLLLGVLVLVAVAVAALAVFVATFDAARYRDEIKGLKSELWHSQQAQK